MRMTAVRRTLKLSLLNKTWFLHLSTFIVGIVRDIIVSRQALTIKLSAALTVCMARVNTTFFFFLITDAYL